MKHYILIVIIFLGVLVPQALCGQVSDSLRQAVLGEHALTLQWLDNQNHGKTGKCLITENKRKLKLDGHQEETVDCKKNFLKMAGTVSIRNARELKFHGTITTKVNYINGGKEHVRKGTFIFKVHGQRRYWRMQNGREQPDGDSQVTDYIDIHFKK